MDILNSSDDELVRSAQKGSMDAYEELVHRHRDKIYARAFSMMRNEDQALDMSQEAWVKAWQRLAQFKHNSSFTTWITRICINLCLDHIRKWKRQKLDSLDKMEEELGGVERLIEEAEDFNPTEKIERSELRERIDLALAKLSHEHRTVLVLHEFEQMEYKEIAKSMHCSIGTVMSRLFYARRKLGKLLISLKKER
mgnify:FL=1